MDEAKHYLTRFQQAETIHEKQAVGIEYQIFLSTLTETERDQAREVMNVLWPQIKKRAEELEPMMQTLEAMIDRVATRPIKA
ncbi:hypothetical protein [Spirosoma areae]